MYIYPEHLKAKATMWLWQLKDLTLVGIGVLFSVFAAAQTGSLVAFILDFISYACAYFFRQQFFEWRISR